MSIFVGKSGVRLRYDDLTAAEVDTATTSANAALLTTTIGAGRQLYVSNDLNVDVVMLVVNPEADPSVVANRLFLLEVPASRVINFADLAPGLSFDPGTQIFIYKVSGTANSGKFRSVYWG